MTITDFNLPLTEISWFIDGVPATAVTGRTGVLTITNTSTTSPPATTTLTLDPVQLPSESGLYSVTAFNPAGMETITFNVIITGMLFRKSIVVPKLLGNQSTTDSPLINVQMTILLLIQILKMRVKLALTVAFASEYAVRPVTAVRLASFPD